MVTALAAGYFRHKEPSGLHADAHRPKREKQQKLLEYVIDVVVILVLDWFIACRVHEYFPSVANTTPT